MCWNVKGIRKIPTAIIHGRYDIVCPITSAWELHKEIPNSEIFLTENLGHRRILRDEQVSQRIVDFLE